MLLVLDLASTNCKLLPEHDVFGPERKVNYIRAAVNEPKVVSKFPIKVLVWQNDQESLKWTSLQPSLF